MYKLVISDDEGKSTVVPLVRDEITIGRKEGNTIRLTERNVSRKHARIRRANGAYIVEDLSSYNGIRLNGRRIDSQAELHSGDQIVIGDYVLALQQEEIAQAVTSTSIQSPPPVPSVAPEPKPLEAEDTALTNVMPIKAEPRPPARLVLIYPPPVGAEFALSSARLRIGRAEHLDICINHRSISREHAELVQQGDSYRVIDLASANGVRVNGDDIQNAIVSPGDVLELGQVRLKFIAEGEVYRVEDDPAAKLAGSSRSKSGAKWPVWTAGAIIAAALGYAAYVATGTGPSNRDTASEELAQNNNDAVIAPHNDVVVAAPDNAEPSVVADDPEEAFGVALTACQEEVANADFAAAAAHAATALQLRPSDAQANRCLQTATTGVSELQTFERARTSFASGDVDAAHAALASLGARSVFRERAEFVEIENGYREAHARLAANDTPPRQGRTPSVPRAQVQQPPRTQVQQPPRQQQNPPRTQTAQNANAANSNVPANPYDEPAPTASRLELARQCAVQGDNQCVVEQLANHARTETEMALLIETYRQMGNNNAAIPLMRRYTERFPTTGRARQYQQVLVHYGQ